MAIRDCQSGGFQEGAAEQVMLAAGPWTGELLARAVGPTVATGEMVRHALGLSLVVGRRLANAVIGLRSERSATEDLIGGGRRFLFLVPQEATTLVGTRYGTVENCGLEATLQKGRRTLLEDVNHACPDWGLVDADIVGYQWGRLPLDRGVDGQPARLADRPRVAGPTELGLANLYAAETVKYTTARAVAERLLDRVAAGLPGPVGPCRSAEVPLIGAGPGAMP